jgi:hypothetical protein
MFKQAAMLAHVGALVATVALGSIGSAPAAAAAQCGPRAVLLEHLSKHFKEQPRVLGLVGSSGIMEIHVSVQGSWTVLVTSASGTACIVAAGESWEELPKISTDPAA